MDVTNLSLRQILIISTIATAIIVGTIYFINNKVQAEDNGNNTEVRYVIVYQPVPIFIETNKDSYDEDKDNGKEVSIESHKMVDMEIYNVTAYTAGYESTGKTPDHPQYGITASGEMVEEGVTIACPPSMEFGTRIYIPYFDNIFTCLDRGAAITEGHLDIYMDDLEEALKFGRRDLPVKILED